MWKRIALLIGILVVYSILVAPAVSAQNTIYFLPQQGIIQEPFNNMTVQVRANLSANRPINTWQTNISFDHTCVNITDFTLPDLATGWSHSLETHHEGCIKIGAFRFACGDADSDILLANLTIHCEQWGCTSPLNFTGIVNDTRSVGCTETNEKYHVAWINGAVTIETEEQNGEERHALGGGGVSQPTPSPTLIIATPTPTESPVETPTHAPTFTPSAPATPTQIPSPIIPTAVIKVEWILVIGLMVVSIMAMIIYVVFKYRSGSDKKGR